MLLCDYTHKRTLRSVIDMPLRGKQASGLLTQQKMLRAAVKLFLEKRYEGTTTAEIARAAGMPPSSAYLYRNTAKRPEGIFGDDLPDAEAKDFYEMEIASTGMMRSFVAVPCDMYFTVERKIARFLECTLKLCNVPPERRRGRRTIGRVGRYLMAPI